MLPGSNVTNPMRIGDMIELTCEQTRALDAPQQPAVAVDPRTGQEYLLIRREIYDKIRCMLKPVVRAADNPADHHLTPTDLPTTPKSPKWTRNTPPCPS